MRDVRETGSGIFKSITVAAWKETRGVGACGALESWQADQGPNSPALRMSVSIRRTKLWVCVQDLIRSLVSGAGPV